VKIHEVNVFERGRKSVVGLRARGVIILGALIALYPAVASAQPTCEDFEDWATLGQPIGDDPAWYDGGGGPAVSNGAGVAGSTGLEPSGAIFTWTSQGFDWNDPEFGGFRVRMDFQTDASGVLDDDRVGWMTNNASTNSDLICGVQVDPDGSNTRLEGYWDHIINSDEDERPVIDELAGSLSPNTFYRLEAVFTKLTATSARVDASLTELDASGDPVVGGPILSGTIADTDALGGESPDPAYFTPAMVWPAYKNHTSAGANADNPCFEVLAPCTVDADCDDGDLCSGIETCNAGLCEAGIEVVCGVDEVCDPGTGLCSILVSEWVAFNDCVYDAGLDDTATDPNGVAIHYIAANVTEFGVGSGFGGDTSGELLNQADGAPTGVIATLTQSGGVIWQPSTGGTGGYDTASGTDAHDTFAGIADMTGVIYYGSSGWTVELTFTGLDPDKEYTFATSANRHNAAYNRLTIYTLSGADTFVNASTPGVDVLALDSVRFNTGGNYDDGFVARWTGITAADGSFSVTAEADPGSDDGYKAYAFDVFMLEQFAYESGPECTIDADCVDDDLCNGDETCDAGDCVPGTPIVCGPGEACDPPTGDCILQPVTETFQQDVDGYFGTVDTYLRAGDTTQDNSVATTLVVDSSEERQVLLRFENIFDTNGGPIPANATINSAQLTINVTNSSTVGARLHRMLQTFNDTDTWDTWGGGIDSDDSEAESTFDSSSPGTDAGVLAVIDVTADLQAWAAGQTNHGWAFLQPAEMGDDSWQFDSAEGDIPPELSVTYTPSACTVDADCDDGNLCNGLETCDPIDGCLPGTDLVCDDGDACNGTETCDSVAGCQAGAPLVCDDGDACNGVETCDLVAGCQAGTPVDCSPGETCDPETGVCVPSVTDVYCEDFEVGFAGSNVGDHPDWFDDDSGPVATAGGGVGNPASVGLAASPTVFTWTAHQFEWADPNIAGVNFQMDYQTGSDGQFDDDRCTWNIDGASTSSANLFGAQLDHPDGGIVTYWRNGTTRIQDEIVALPTLPANAWYRFRVEITKLTAGSARIDVSLTELDANGDPTGVPYSGTVPDTSQWGTAGDSAPNVTYFTAPGMFPAYKTYTDSAGNADNACFEIVWAGGPEGAPDQPTLISPPHNATNVSLSPELRVNVTDPDDEPMDATFYAITGTGPAGEDFSIAVLPDTQYYSESYPATFNAQTQWIVANKDIWNIVYVAHEGDLVQTASNITEWERADTAMSFLEDPVTTGLLEGMSYGVVPGNHDLPTTNYNIYFGDTRFLGRSYYGGPYAPGNNDNNYTLFSAGGMDFIVIGFGYDTSPDAAVLTWADNLLSTHSDRRAIVVSHFIMDIGVGAAFSTQGQAIYDALNDNPNLFLMLCGHRHGEGLRTDPNLATGDPIYTVLADYQDIGNGGDGWLRIMEFSPANDEIRVYTYNVLTDTFGADPIMTVDSTVMPFTLAYDMNGSSGPVELGTVSGVASGDDAAISWPGLSPGTAYDWYVEIDDGTFTTTSPTWTFTTQCVADGDCDDGDLCTTDACNVDTCEFTPVVCDPGETCDPDTGLCEAPATTLMFQDGLDGYDSTHDTYLQQNSPDNVNGNLEGWEWDDNDPNGTGNVNLGVIRFDNIFGNGPGQIPVGAQIESAVLRYTIGGSGGPEGVTAELHEVTVPWDQATASWNNFGGDAGATEGDEYSAGIVASAPATAVGPYDVDVIASLAAWVNDPSSNNGWIAVPPPPGQDGGGAEVRSSEYMDNTDERPKLTVTYRPPVPCTVDLDCFDGNVCNGEESCDVSTGECLAGIPLVCDDGDACNGAETCDPATGCQPGIPPNCDDGNVCTDDDCDPAVGCTYTFNNDPCEDGDPCTTNDACVDGFCVGGPPPECDESLLLAEDFELYNPGDDPVDWLDTGADNSLLPAEYFQVFDVTGNRALGTTVTLTNIHSHYVGPGSSNWAEYTFTGRMRMSDIAGGIGVTFLSDYPNSERYYRLRRGNFLGGKVYSISSHGTGIPAGTVLTGVDPVANVWYRFRIEVTDTGLRTEIRAKVWPEGDPEPASWQADCYDDSAIRLTTGTVGVWSMGRGAKYWDDFVVSGSPCGLLITDCDDGDLCNGEETCQDGVCVSGTPLVCEDANACTVDDCDPAIGCTYAPIDPVVDCDDVDECTLDECDPAVGCTHSLIDCDDGNACTTEFCDPAAGCIITAIDPVVDCDDFDACTSESCDPATGCVSTPIEPVVDCNDGDSCTEDTCDSVLGCVNTPIPGCESDVDVEVTPVVTLVDPATTTGISIGAPPLSAATVTSQSAYWVEVWASDTGTENTGLTGVYVDVSFCDDTTATGVDHGATFVTLVSGAIQPTGVDEFGGSALPHGGGIEPEWIRVGWIQMNAGAVMLDCEIALSPSTTGVGTFGRGLVPWDRVTLGSVLVSTSGEPNDVTYDLDGDGFIGVGDLSLWAVSFNQLVPPALAEHDFDCDGFVGVGDLAWFATGWMKFVGDPTIMYPPPCPAPAIARAAGSTDVEFRLTARVEPSDFDVSATPPRSKLLRSPGEGEMFYIEVWATDTGDINTGLTSAYVDLAWSDDAISARRIARRGTFTYLPGGSIGPDTITDLGGSALPGGDGAQPRWVRVALVEMVVQAPPSSVTFFLTPSQTGVAAYGRGLVPRSDVLMDELTVSGPAKPTYLRPGPRRGR
jgi:hypothetical protein